MKAITLLFACVPALVAVSSLAAQQSRYTLQQRGAAGFGFSARAAGDVDLDGVPDIVVGARDADSANGRATGQVFVYSGRGGRLLHTLHGERFGDLFGLAVAGAGDVDNDGHDDVIVGAPFHGQRIVKGGAAQVFSGRTGRVIHTFRGSRSFDQLGYSVASAGDVDRDGHADVLVGVPGNDSPAGDCGLARLYSGRTGLVLRTFRGVRAEDRLGRAVAGGRDLNRDGFPDVIVGAIEDSGLPGYAKAYSGRNGRVLWTLRGRGADDMFGDSVDMVGDLDGDGHPDVFVGAPERRSANRGNGYAIAFSGKDGSVLHELDGDRRNSGFGASVAGAGDTDGDGCPDLIVGEAATLTSKGKAVVYSGRSGVVLFTLAGGTGELGDSTGFSVASAGDIDCDGRAEVLVSSFESITSFAEGRVVVFGGPRLALPDLLGDVRGDEGVALGGSVGAADVDGDGKTDLILGGPGGAKNGPLSGIVQVFLGPGRTRLREHHGGVGDRLGTAVSGAGDVNGDGFEDYVIGAPRINTVRRAPSYALVISGRDGSTLHRFASTEIGDDFGRAVDGAGDIDCDGYDDVIVGAPFHQPRGLARVFSGKDGSVLRTFRGTSFGSRFGNSVAGAGDMDGDGCDDFLVGAPRDDKRGDESGSVFAYSGRTGRVLFILVGRFAGQRFGTAVASAGDADGDGHVDIVVGAPDAYHHGLQTGHVKLFSGKTGRLMRVWLGSAAGDRFGASIDGGGDVNGDGVPDIVVGAPQDFAHVRKCAGYARTFSTDDGRLLFSFAGQRPRESFGYSVAMAGDVDFDGNGDFAVGAPASNDPAFFSGYVRVFGGRGPADRPKVMRYGAACPAANGKLPRVGLAGRPVLGGSYRVGLSRAPSETAAVFRIGTERANLALDGIGMPGCTALTLPLVDLVVATDAGGTAGASLPVPNATRLIGRQVYFQWFALDRRANALGLIATSGLAVTFGRQ